MDKLKKKAALLGKRRKRSRAGMQGTAERPRMVVTRSVRHVYVQVIDDVAGRTLLSASSFEKGQREIKGNVEGCQAIGRLLAQRCRDKNITKVVFDRHGRQYHGRVKAIAEGARSEGLLF